MTPAPLTPAADFVLAAKRPCLRAWCRGAAPEELERFGVYGRKGSDFVGAMARHGIHPAIFCRTFPRQKGVDRTPLWIAGDVPSADDLDALHFLDRCDHRDVVHIAARQSLRFETFLRWQNRRPEEIGIWLYR